MTFNNLQGLVSVIMPAYNSEKFIEESIKSVKQQTYKHWELLIIDDCSSDGTISLVEKILKEDTRIKLIRNEKNIGVSETRNKGIELAEGEWIAFLDSDDIWEPKKLEVQLKDLENNRGDFSFTGSSFINEIGIPFKGLFKVPKKSTFNSLKYHNVISCSSVVIKKAKMLNVKMKNDDFHEDYAAWLEILKSGVEARGINEPLLIYRISKNSKSGNKFKTLKMTYKVYRHVGINKVMSVVYLFTHIINSIKKYHYIINGK